MSMKKLSTFLIALLIAQISFAQTFINEDFSSTTFPPNGWTIDGLPNQWSRSSTTDAGGEAPEAKFTYLQTTTTSRLVSPVVDLTGVDAATLNFNHFYDFYSAGVTIGVATRSGGGDWEVAWQVNPSGNVGPVVQTVELTDIEAEDFQFSIFISGNLYNVDYWYIDNIVLFVRQNLDAGIQSIDIPSYFVEDQDVSGKIINNGIETVSSFDVNWTSNEGDVNTTSFDGLSMATNQTYNFTADQQFQENPGTYDFKIWVSNVNGGDDENPDNDTINKVLSVATQSVQRRPLFEEFTSSTCAPCASFNNGVFNPFIEANGDDIALIKYQMNWPGSGDPYYTAEGGVRRTFYGVSAVPQLFVEGKNTPANSGGVNSAFNNAMADPSFMEIEGMHIIEGTDITVEANIMPYISLAGATLHIVVIEEVTTGNVASNGETEFHHVMMKMLPNANGTAVDLTAGVTTTVNYSYDMSSTNVEEMDDLMVVIFVQDNSNKGILQAVYSEETGGFPASVLFDPIPGTTGVETFADVNITLSEAVTMIGGDEITNDNVASLITFTETEGDAFPFTATINDEKTVITVSPEGLMDSYTSYTVTLDPVENEAGFPTEVISTYFETGMHVGLSENKLEGIRSVQPNPVTNQAQINFSLETAGQLTIEVYDLKGQMVDQIASEQFSKGNHSISWTPAQSLPAGMYIIRMSTQNQYYNSKVLLNR